MFTNFVNSLFYFDPLATVMIILIGVIGLTVANFSKRYLDGNTRYYRFFWILSFLIISVSIMVCADNLFLLLLAWCISNALLVNLMIFNPNWEIAKASGTLATKNFALGFFLVASAFTIFYQQTGQSSVQSIIHQGHNGSLMMTTALVLLAIGAMTQSAILPFHKWLLSSLNSPTPVSAIMHAGLVNGGGFLLTRFSSIYADSPILLNLLFTIGLASALVGTLFKLMQSDVKRMLACSTMGQMGFMIAQCGLGLFPAAIAHLCWHGLFKAYLFLGSGSIAQEKRLDLHYPPSLCSFFTALTCGIVGSYMFSLTSAKTWLAQDTTLVLLIVAFISTAHFSLSILRQKPLARLSLALMATAIIGAFYGFSVHLIELILRSMNTMHPQPLNGFYITGILLLVCIWVIFIFWRNPKSEGFLQNTIIRLYVKVLNASQPDPTTITTHRNYYKYM